MNVLVLTFWTWLATGCMPTYEPVVYVTEEDKKLFNEYIEQIAFQTYNTPEELVIATASFFLDRPYVGATLEKEPEGLVVNLRELDCTTFVETVYALSKTVLEENKTFDAFCRNLQAFRYRNRKIENYISRLHYTSDWIYENERKGLMKDLTRSLGGEPLNMSLSFMSRHPNSYRQLKKNSNWITAIATIEDKINSRSYFFIPRDRITTCQAQIRDGDMICLVTSIEGLDISHVALAKRVDGELRVIHASSSRKKVIVEPQSIQAYTQSIQKNIGIMVIRPAFYQNNSKAKRIPKR
ncbi:MAG: DUF1460 domain-containing protein [Massilibacteroides sp.]|nr:DUF1460 domain-containing protein [Massilibacteroides sp.]